MVNCQVRDHHDFICFRYNQIMNVVQTLDRLLQPVAKSLTVRSAEALVKLRADPIDQARIEELAAKCTEDELTRDEQAEYDAYVSANTLIAILQAQARAVIARHRGKSR